MGQKRTWYGNDFLFHLELLTAELVLPTRPSSLVPRPSSLVLEFGLPKKIEDEGRRTRDEEDNKPRKCRITRARAFQPRTLGIPIAPRSLLVFFGGGRSGGVELQ